MCGRYALNENARELADHFHLVSVPELVPRFNIPPGVQVLVVRHSVNGPTGEMMLWGLAPAWTRSAAQSRAYPRPINARAESIQDPALLASFLENDPRHARLLMLVRSESDRTSIF